MGQFKILLLNCTGGSEPSEMNFLAEFFWMMKKRYPKSIEFSSVDIKSKRDFINQLKLTWPNIVHISAHGWSDKFKSGRRGKNTSIYIGNECVTSADIAKLPKITRKLVSVSACLASYRDMADAFLKIGAKYYLAPKTEIGWVEAALFFVMFYKRYLYDRKSLAASFKYARENTKLGSHFREYWYSE